MAVIDTRIQAQDREAAMMCESGKERENEVLLLVPIIKKNKVTFLVQRQARRFLFYVLYDAHKNPLPSPALLD